MGKGLNKPGENFIGTRVRCYTSVTLEKLNFARDEGKNALY